MQDTTPKHRDAGPPVETGPDIVPRHRRPAPCSTPGCRGRHCAGGDHRPANLARRGARMQTTDARLTTR